MKVRVTSLMAECDDEIVRHIADALRVRNLDVALELGRYEQRERFAQSADFVWTCGLPYVRGKLPGQPIIAPLYTGESRACYWSDVVARDTSALMKTEPTWAVNDWDSNSGFSMPKRRYRLSHVQLTGSHMKSMHAVADGRTDVAAVDSHVFEQARQIGQFKELVVIDRIGPDPAPPWVASAGVDKKLMSLFVSGVSCSLGGGIEGWQEVDDSTYSVLRSADPSGDECPSLE